MTSQKKTVSFFTVIFFVALCLGIGALSLFNEAKAAGPNELTGWAWSSNVGWISFNCENQGSCGSAPYAVSLISSANPTVKKFSGWAWSSNVGWITFNESELSGRSAVTMNLTSGALKGWARSFACIDPGCQGAPNGWDGWIHFSGPHYSSPDSSGNGGVTFDPSLCILKGFAWGGGDEGNFPGWIHFQGDNYAVNVPSSFCSAPSLTITLRADPPVGDLAREVVPPFLDVRLEARVIVDPGGIQPFYSFSFDCGDGSGFGVPQNGASPFSHICRYAQRGTYTARVNVTRPGADPNNFASAKIIVKPPLPSFNEAFLAPLTNYFTSVAGLFY